MNTEPEQLGSLYLSHSYHIRKVGVNNVPHSFGWGCWYPLIWQLACISVRSYYQECL
jgi:hypothetical protein